MTDKAERQLSSQKVYEGKIINLSVDTVALPSGRSATREIVEHPGAVAIVPINEKKEILLVKQYRYAVRKALLEIPAGKLEPLENTTDCAKRELLEETGFLAANLQKLFHYYSSPGFTNEMLHIFIATGLTYKGAQPDEDEDIELITMPFQQAIEWIRQGKICDGKTIAGIFAAYQQQKLTV